MDHQVSRAGWYLRASSANLWSGHDPLEILRDEELYNTLCVGDTHFIKSFV